MNWREKMDVLVLSYAVSLKSNSYSCVFPKITYFKLHVLLKILLL